MEGGGARGRFAADTAVTPLGHGAFEAAVRRRWWVARGPNGGYLAALILRALTETVGDPARAPRSLTVHFLAVPEEGPVRIECAVERAGRSLSTLSARLLQGERVMALGLAAFSAPWTGMEYADAPMPDVRRPEDLARVETGGLPEFVAPCWPSRASSRWCCRRGGEPCRGDGRIHAPADSAQRRMA